CVRVARPRPLHPPARRAHSAISVAYWPPSLRLGQHAAGLLAHATLVPRRPTPVLRLWRSASRRAPMHSRRQLYTDLRVLGVAPGSVVMVHASVRAVRALAGGPDERHLALKGPVTYRVPFL